MAPTTKTRLFGLAVLAFNIYLVGSHPFSLIEKSLLLFGFAVGFELFVVRVVRQTANKPDSELATARLARPSIAASTLTGSTVPATVSKPVPQPSLEEEVAALGIERAGDAYRYQSYRYDRLEDALRYARHDQSR